MKVVDSVHLDFRGRMTEVEFLIEVNVLTDEVCSLDGNIVPHSIVLVADVITKVKSSTDPGEGDTTQLNVTNVSISIEESNTLGFKFCRIFICAELEIVSRGILFTCLQHLL